MYMILVIIVFAPYLIYLIYKEDGNLIEGLTGDQAKRISYFNIYGIPTGADSKSLRSNSN